MKREYAIDTDLPVEYRDEPPWRSYRLEARGHTAAELRLNATVSEIDQDGGELRTYGLDDAPNAVLEAGQEVIRKTVNDAVEVS